MLKEPRFISLFFLMGLETKKSNLMCLDYVLRTSIDKIKQNGFELTKKRNRRYPAKTITDTDNADDIAILGNTSNQAETRLNSLERAAIGTGLLVNGHKTEYMCYNQTGDISTLDRTSLKLVDKFTYIGSSVSSTEKDIDTRLTKALTAIDKLSIIWKSDLTYKMKQFLPGSGHINTAVWMHYLDANKTAGEKARWQLHKNVTSNIEQVLAATPHKAPTIRPPASHHETIQVRRNRHAGHCWRSRDKLISDVLSWTPTYGLAKAGRPVCTYISYVRIRDVALKTC